MPNISNVLVASGTGLSTAGNGGRKLVRLANGTLISGHYNSSSAKNIYSKSVDNGNTWTATSNTLASSPTAGFAMATNGTNVYSLYVAGNGIIRFVKVDVNGSNLAIDDQSVLIESQSGGAQAVSLSINEAGTELHAAWSSKNATYPNSFNIRYAKGKINPDGSVTWGAAEQRTSINTSGNNNLNPSIIVIADGTSRIFFDGVYGNNDRRIQMLRATGFASTQVFQGDLYAQSNPSAIFVPQSINGLANGRMWVAWHGKDATDSAKFNIRVSYSDDGGVTWATPVKLTSGNTFDRLNPSLSADKTGKVFVLYEDHQWSPDIGIRMKTFSGGSWGAEVGVATADTAEQHPSALVDFTLQMTTPPFVYTDTTEGIRFTGNFNVGASVSPVSGALGNKETPTLTAYTVTPEAGSTVTQIVERVNGAVVNTFNNPASLSRTLTVPNATYDTLAYFATHTASITVTDSNGAQTVTTYTFDKMLANEASLLEATKANTDAKNRISTKRDALAAQVGLSAGSTFDAISSQLASGVFKKFVPGTFTTNASGNATINNLTFSPTLVVYMGPSLRSGFISLDYKRYNNIADGAAYGVNAFVGVSSSHVYNTLTSNGFNIAGISANVTFEYLAFGN